MDRPTDAFALTHHESARLLDGLVRKHDGEPDSLWLRTMRADRAYHAERAYQIACERATRAA